MITLFKRLLGGKHLPGQLTYEEGRAALEAREERLEQELAARQDAEPEMLYYLSERGSEKTRRAVAANPSTPAAANRKLADDASSDVRAELARKIGRLLPELLGSEREIVIEQTLAALEKLATDQIPHVRAILADEVKKLDCAPRRVIARLARDVEETVSAPILEYSPLLSDEDLIEIVASARARGAIAAVARRRGLSEAVSEAVVATMDIPAIAVLLANPNARIREETIEKLLDRAETTTEWHSPLVMRADLSLRVLRRVAGFVSAALVEQLAKRSDLDKDTLTHLNRCVRARLQEEAQLTAEHADKASLEVNQAAKEGKLTERFIETAAEAGNRDTVIAGLARMTKSPRFKVEKIFASRNAKAITALAWKAGISMRIAFKIQALVVKLKADELLPARVGIAYPLTEAEMRWHLSYFGMGEEASQS
jgi:uncharacterized protein (DUF2336 family)